MSVFVVERLRVAPAPRSGTDVPTLTADWLLLGAVLLLFVLSPNALFAFGLPYEATGGTPLGKFHPGTFLAGFALIARLAATGFSGSAGTLLARHPGASAFGAVCVFTVAYVALVLTVPVTPVIETFVLPLILFATFVLRDRPIPRLALVLHGIFLVNAVIGLGEFASGHRLTPFVAGTVVITDDWRSTALFGHPLANALLVSSYIVALTLRPAGLPSGWRLPTIGVQLAALVVFGGRTALVMTVLFLAVAAILQVMRFLGGARVGLVGLAIAVLCVPLLAIAIGGLWELGFFDLVVRRFVADEGSANARVLMFKLFDGLPTRDLMFGPDPELIGTAVRREGLEFGIESFPVAFVLLYGLAVASIFFTGLTAYCVDLVRATRPATTVVLVFFFLAALTSTSLASKTTVFGMLTVMVLAFFPPPRGGRAGHLPC